MEELSEEQVVDRLLRLENEGPDRRAELTGERFLSLIHDPERGRAYVLRHGLDETEGAEVPEGTEFWEYDRMTGELVDEDSTEDLGDTETDGAELRDLHAADEDDPLVNPESDEP